MLAGNLVLHGILIKVDQICLPKKRPLLHLVEEGGYSFPSGHAMATAIVLGTLIIIVQQRVQNQHIKRLVQALLYSMIFSLLWPPSLSLGMHYPTDVIGEL